MLDFQTIDISCVGSNDPGQAVSVSCHIGVYLDVSQKERFALHSQALGTMVDHQ